MVIIEIDNGGLSLSLTVLPELQAALRFAERSSFCACFLLKSIISLFCGLNKIGLSFKNPLFAEPFEFSPIIPYATMMMSL